MYEINFTKAAESDLDSADSYITYSLKNEIAAKRLLDEVDKQLNVLQDMPECCPLAPDCFLASEGVHMKIIKNYLLFYVIREKSKSILVLRFLHSSRNWISILTNDVIDNFPLE